MGEAVHVRAGLEGKFLYLLLHWYCEPETGLRNTVYLKIVRSPFLPLPLMEVIGSDPNLSAHRPRASLESGRTLCALGLPSPARGSAAFAQKGFDATWYKGRIEPPLVSGPKLPFLVLRSEAPFPGASANLPAHTLPSCPPHPWKGEFRGINSTDRLSLFALDLTT